MCAQSIENFVLNEKLRPSLRVRVSLLWPEICKYRKDGYSIRIIWKYLLSEQKIPQVSYTWFASLVGKLAKSMPDPTTQKVAAKTPPTVVSTVENQKPSTDSYEPRRSNYEEPKPFRVSPVPKSPRELFSKKLAKIAQEEGGTKNEST